MYHYILECPTLNYLFGIYFQLPPISYTLTLKNNTHTGQIFKNEAMFITPTHHKIHMLKYYELEAATF